MGGQEEVLGHCGAQGISAPRKEGLVYQWSVPEKNKHGGRGNIFVNVLLKFIGLSRKIKVINSKCDSMKVCYTP